MKALKNPKGLKLKPCLNCVAYFGKLGCPCLNHSGEIHRKDGKIVSFFCENRKMHQGFPNAPETHTEARRAKRKSKVFQHTKPKTR